jgi:hypothetical protein
VAHLRPQHKRRRVPHYRLKSGELIMPIWRADYFDKARDQAPTRSVIIEAEYESDALDEARAKMSSACFRAEITRIVNSSATIH